MHLNTLHRLARNVLPMLLLQIACATAFAQGGLLTAPQDITQLTAKANQVIRGQIINVKIEPHPQYSNLQTVVVTLRVQETLKGPSSQIYTFRQVILGQPQSRSAGYSRGAEVVLFMHSTNENGVTSPVGVSQGIFTVTRDQNGRGTVMNGAGNRGLFGDTGVRERLSKLKMSPSMRSRITAQEGGPLDLETMQSMVRQLAAGEAR